MLVGSTTCFLIMSAKFLDIIATRRTFYQLGAKSPISDLRIQEILNQVVLHVPSAFNSQTTRVVLLLKQEHIKLWDIVKESVKGVAPAEQWPATEKKLSGFQAAYGTVSSGPSFRYSDLLILMCGRFCFLNKVRPFVNIKTSFRCTLPRFLLGPYNPVA